MQFFQQIQAFLADYGKDLLGWGHIIVGCDFRQGFVYGKMLLKLFEIAENDEGIWRRIHLVIFGVNIPEC